MAQKKIKQFSGYTGSGGAEFALKKAGIKFECVGFSEIKKSAIKIYELNHPGTKNFGNINNIAAKDLPDFDIFTGGFPCQDVSIAGLRDLDKGRTKTVKKALKLIEIKKPKYVLLENVKGILSAESGEFLAETIRQLKGLGYAVSYKLLNSSDYGTPQNRERVYIAAEFNRDSFGYNPFPSKSKLKLSVQDLLESNVDDKYYLTPHQIEYSSNYGIKRGKTFEKNINLKISRCLTARSPKRACHDITLIKDKRGIRVMTPREYFRLQGFVNDEINFGDSSDAALYEAAGNGWDINLVSKIFSKMFESENNLFQEETQKAHA